MITIDRTRLAEMYAREQEAFTAARPKSKAAYERAEHLFGRVPMTWMNKKAGGFPIYLDRAHGNRVWDIDGHEYIDFALGDTGSMAGHSNPIVVEAVTRRIGELGGLVTMLPTEDAEWVGAELSRRNVGAPVDVTETSRAAEYNDLPGLERALAHGDVAAVLIEPALTNIGIVLPEPGYLEGVRELTRKYDALLIIDETHTFSAGPGGMTTAYDLEPDLVVIGKSIGGGIPTGAYGLSAEFAERALARTDLDLVDMGGVGGTLAGNPVSVAAMRATLEHVLTDEAFTHMIDTATYFTDGVDALFDQYDLPWAINQLGARAEYRFARPYPLNGTAAAEAADGELEDMIHLYLANRGIMLTPFHNMALMAPMTTRADVDAHHAAFEECIRELTAP